MKDNYSFFIETLKPRMEILLIFTFQHLNEKSIKSTFNRLLLLVSGICCR
jgi:hypothetical protein